MRERESALDRGEEAKPLYTEVYCRSLNLLVEAKGTVERDAIRMALGQLADYRRFLNATRCAILLPSKPSDDLLDVARREQVFIVWQDGPDYRDLDDVLLSKAVSDR